MHVSFDYMYENTRECYTVERTIIHINGIEYRITEDNQGLMVINKVDAIKGDDSINIIPSCTNEIKVK